MGLHEYANLHHTVVWLHNPGHAVDDVHPAYRLLQWSRHDNISA